MSKLIFNFKVYAYLPTFALKFKLVLSTRDLRKLTNWTHSFKIWKIPHNKGKDTKSFKTLKGLKNIICLLLPDTPLK